MNKLKPYKGAGGKQPKQPTNTIDNLFSRDKVEILLGIGEGPIVGLQDGLKSFFVGEVPLHNPNPDASPNFNDLDLVELQGESTPETVTFLLGGESHSTDVGTNVTKKTPVIRYTPANMRGRFNRIDIRINVAQLYAESGGGVLPNTAKFRVEYKASQGSTWNVVTTTRVNGDPLGALLVATTVDKSLSVASQVDGINAYELRGKTNSGFVLDFSVAVSTLADDDYMIRITKFNPDIDPSATEKIAAEIVFDSFQLINQPTRTFSNTAMVKVVGTASDQFSSIPQFHGIYKGLLTFVPSNYVPEALGIANSYPTPWNGGLTKKWHSNPAWVLYDLLVNPRYGLAKYVNDLSFNLQDFYEAGVFCDEVVASLTNNATEKRYTMNLTIAENQTAWDYLQNIAGSFDAVLFDDGEGVVRLKVDKWVDPRVLFTPETINAEGFNYSYTDLTTRYNQITVSFTNPERGWEQSRRKYPDDTAILSSPYYLDNGLVPFDMVAVGCTNESEAIRRAQARILTSNNETTIVNFTTTRLGVVLDPLEIIYLSDPVMGWGFTGRVESINDLQIRLRDPLNVSGYPLTVEITLQHTLGLAVHAAELVDAHTLNVISDTITFLQTDFPENAQFSIKVDELGLSSPKPFRITAIEPLEGYDLFRVTALEVYKQKYDVTGNEDDPVVPIDRDTFDLNLRDYFLNKANHSAQRTYNNVTFVIDGTVEQAQGSFLLITSTDVNQYALTIGDWSSLLPVGVKPKIIIKGAVRIYGKGGKGGDGGGLIPVVDNYNYFYQIGPDYGDFGDATAAKGKAGLNGGNAAYLDYPIEVEVETGATLNWFGGYGGGYGGDGCLVSVPIWEVVQGALANQNISVFRLQGAGGSGGYPYGEAGSSGAASPPATFGVPSGNAGTKTASGAAAVVNSPYRVAQTQMYVTHGQGAAGSPDLTIVNPVPYFNPHDGQPRHDLVTSTGSRVNGSQGIGIINRANLTLTVNGFAMINSDLYGNEVFP